MSTHYSQEQKCASHFVPVHVHFCLVVVVSFALACMINLTPHIHVIIPNEFNNTATRLNLYFEPSKC